MTSGIRSMGIVHRTTMAQTRGKAGCRRKLTECIFPLHAECCAMQVMTAGTTRNPPTGRFRSGDSRYSL